MMNEEFLYCMRKSIGQWTFAVLLRCMALGVLFLSSCKIDNDIPYPIVYGNITALEVEGQRAGEDGGNVQATISEQNRTVTLYVDDSVDLSELRITRLTVSNEAELIPDSAACRDYARFPRSGFASLDDLPLSMDTRMDFTQPVHFTLRTYQDYDWTVTVEQIIDRQIMLQNQIGNPIVDTNTRTVIIYVDSEQPLNAIKVTSFNLAGAHGTVAPDPTEFDTFDFSSPVDFYATYGWEEVSYRWRVYVYHQESSGAATGDVFARVTTASLNGSIQNGKTPVVEYKTQSESTWTELSSSAVTVRGTSYAAEFSGLSAGTTYQYRVSVDGVAGAEQSFTTAPATPLENGGFENWYMDGKVYIPNVSGSSFWGSGNPGAAQFLSNLTTPTSDAVSGQAALLESKDAVIKLGAGNIFTGDFALDGTNGILHFGQPFTTFPTALRFYYKYTSTTINKIGNSVGELENLRGRPDSCHVYIALSDKSEPYEIRTAPSKRQVFDKNDANIIAYGEFISAQTTSSYQQITIPLEYRVNNRTPRYIVIVASASKYGDYFIGGVGSTLWLDEMELVYE